MVSMATTPLSPWESENKLSVENNRVITMIKNNKYVYDPPGSNIIYIRFTIIIHLIIGKVQFYHG